MNIDGLVLESKYPEYQFAIKGPLQKVWKDGFPVDEQQIIFLQFDRYLCELDDMAQAQEWGEAQKEAVARQLERFLNDHSFRDMWVHEAAKPGKPWPTYDDTHHNQIAVIAQATGTIGEALIYEQKGRPGGPRESVVKKLSELLDTPSDADDTEPAEVEAELYAA